MLVNIVIGALIFGYAGWTLFRYIKKSKEGKCAACSLKDSCQSDCGNDSSSRK
ncbi:FeoB-associated Cys-rich membrane protein [Pseudobacillus badius]|uniref:FeoB-associated Cys-rich membrane protein n=1 Tax=Bacillus badius TaxID=1455 RepID=UPI0007B05756|nr:FeoB-associated Cys-rich membrane protein [Bacillus badius]KZN99734.1 hydrolase [Bacillus badius]MED0666519.1 FeoB-associated Cys-rich membrane protein [Bacillus badius]OCS85838.1 hydrolase [Bacillus badius]OVE51804.1 hydrolase [Bacillus badius]GLY11005.1 hydrolase [Bacillus badius]